MHKRGTQDTQDSGLTKQMETIATQAVLGSSLPDRIGSTPLVRLEQVVHGLDGITLLGKAEWANPGGSVKDRAAAAMVRDARQRGLLTAGKTMLDATSGNTGIALAMLGAALGHSRCSWRCHPMFLRSENASSRHTAQWWTGPIPTRGSDGAIRRARELAGNDPERFCYRGSILERRQLEGAL